MLQLCPFGQGTNGKSQVVAISTTHATTLVLDNSLTSALAVLLGQLEKLPDYFLASNHLNDLHTLRKEVFGY